VPQENHPRQQLEDEGAQYNHYEQPIWQSELLEEKDLSHLLTNVQQEPS